MAGVYLRHDRQTDKPQFWQMPWWLGQSCSQLIYKSFSPKLPSHPDCHVALSRVPCAIQWVGPCWLFILNIAVNEYMFLYGWVPLLFTRNYQTLSIGYTPIQNKIFKKREKPFHRTESVLYQRPYSFWAPLLRTLCGGVRGLHLLIGKLILV